jgi:hypothetical protein
VNALGSGINRLFDLLVAPLAGVPAVAMVVLSVLTAVLALLIFKHTTDRHKLDEARDRLIGHIYEMGLYQDHLRVLGRIQGRLAVANLRYLAVTLPALVALLVPMVLVVVQLESRFAHRPPAAGERTMLTVVVDPVRSARVYDLELDVPQGVTVEAGPVRSLPAGTVSWRLRVDEPGAQPLRVLLEGEEVAARTVRPDGRLPRLNESSGTGWLDPLLYPGAAALPEGGVIQELTLQLPERSTRYLGVELHWLLAFCIFSLAGGLVLKGPLKVSL